MNIPDEMIFRVRIETALFTSIFGILVMATAFVTAIIALFVNDISVLYRILASIGAILLLVYGMYYLCSLWITRLEITNNGILYCQPFNKVFCEWHNIVNLQISKEHLFLNYDEGVNKTGTKIGKLFPNFSNKIPLHYFVRKWTQSDDWKNNILLRRIAELFPEVENEIILLRRR